MPVTRVYTAVFNLPLYPRQLQQWRGAVSGQAVAWKAHFEKAGLPTHLFHNHDEDTGKQRHKYPLIQYKIIRRCAAIVGIGKGAEAVALWLKLFNGQLQMGGRQQQATVAKETDIITTLKKSRKLVHYRIYVWKALNAADMARWNGNDRLTERVALLDEKLQKHLLQLTAALNWKVAPEQLTAYLCYMGQTEKLEGYHPGRYLAFSAVFACNLCLPDEVGLGQEVAIGFGKLQRLPKA